MDTMTMFKDEVAKCGDESMTNEERRAAYAYFLRGWHLGRMNMKEAEKDWLSLERQYSESLGRLAKLCDVVCPWVIANYEEGDDESPAVKVAAEEIMEYVDAVRPPILCDYCQQMKLPTCPYPYARGSATECNTFTKAAVQKWSQTCRGCGTVETWEAKDFFDATDKLPEEWGYDQLLKGPVCPKCKA